MRNLILPFIYLLSSAAVFAEVPVPSVSEKLRVEGTVLVFDTETGPDDREIETEDVAVMRDLLRANPSVRLLRLNSGGGSVYAADDLARIVADYNLDTEVDGKCTSSCVTVFLGGKVRSMTQGSAIGFHSRWWSAEDIARYYEDNKVEEGWTTPFALGSWIYEDTQGEVYRALRYVISRGVDPEFAIEMHAQREQMWYPTRAELEAAGLLRR